MRRHWVIAVAFALVACSQPEKPPAMVFSPWHSGSRLRAMVYDGGDGAQVLRGWFDAMLGEACEFEPTEDGSVRCLPNPSGAYYIDPACTQIAYASLSVCAPESPAFMSVPNASSSTCEPKSYKVYALAAPALVNALYQATPGGACSPTPVGNGVMAQLGTPADPSRFVAATTHLVPTADAALDVEQRLAADGSYTVVGLGDTKRGYACEDCVLRGCVIGLGDYENRCPPRGLSVVYEGQFFSDATCSSDANVVEVGTAATTCVAPAKYALVGRGSPSAFSLDIESLGPEVSASGVFADDSMTCKQAALVDPAGSFHQLGSPVPPETFLKVATGTIGAGRLRVRAWLDAHRHPLLQPSDAHIEDGTNGCNPMRFADGLACVPDNAGNATVLYTDNACSAAVVLADGPVCAGSAKLVVAANPQSTVQCERELLAYSVGAPVPSMGAVYMLNGSTCEPYPGTPATVCPLAPIDPFSVWAPVTERTE